MLSTDANPVSGLGAEKGSHLSVIDNPADPFYRLLVLHGTDGADLVRAARYLTLRSAELSGRRQPVEDVASPPRAANDSPRWVSTEMPVELGSLVPGDQLFFRPTQSEFVLLQFGDLAAVSEHRIQAWWPPLPQGEGA